MEVQFCWIQTLEIAALDKPSAFWSKVVLGIVRQCSLFEAKRDALAFNVLLPNTRHDLRDVDVASLGSSSDHITEPV